MGSRLKDSKCGSVASLFGDGVSQIFKDSMNEPFVGSPDIRCALSPLKEPVSYIWNEPSANEDVAGRSDIDWRSTKAYLIRMGDDVSDELALSQADRCARDIIGDKKSHWRCKPKVMREFTGGKKVVFRFTVY